MTTATADVEAPSAGGRVDVGASVNGWPRAAPQRHQQATVPEVLELVGALDGGVGEGVNAARGRRVGAGLLLDHLGRHPGVGWQQRWAASGLEEVGPAGFRATVCAAVGVPASAARLCQLTSGLGALLTVDVIRPSFEFLWGARLNHVWSRLLGWRRDPHGDILGRVGSTAQTRSRATALLARLVVVTGRRVAELTAADLLACRAAVLARSTRPWDWGTCGCAWPTPGSWKAALGRRCARAASR